MTGYENHFCLSGKSWKGGEAPFPIDCHPEERKQRGISINGGGLCPPPTSPEINFFAVLGLVGKGSFPLPNNRRSFATLRTTRKKAEIPHKRRSG